VARRAAVAQHEPHLRGDRDAGGRELVGVGRDLEERGDLRVAGQLRVDDRVGDLGRRRARTGAGVVLADEEVRAAEEATVEHGALVDDVDAAAQQRDRALVRRPEVVGRVPALGPEDRHAAVRVERAGRRVVRAEALEVVLQHALLVREAELSRALEHRVARHRSRGGGAAQAEVESAEERQLARRRQSDVGRAAHQHVIKNKHGDPSHGWGDRPGPNLPGDDDTRARPRAQAQRRSPRWTPCSFAASRVKPRCA
jgi:hypothetical protein